MVLAQRTADESREALSSSTPLPPSRQECRDSLLLTRLVALNHSRAAEERKGLIRWLRPDYQNPRKSGDATSDGTSRPPLQGELDGTETPKVAKKKNPPPPSPGPPPSPPKSARSRNSSPHHRRGGEAISAHFGKKNAKRAQQVAEILETLQGLGKL